MPPAVPRMPLTGSERKPLEGSRVSGRLDSEESIRVDGKQATVGGTSAVAPLWTGLITLVNQGIGKPAGYINPLLYGKASASAFRDVVSGTNGAYDAGPGWDACTGWGSPDGAKLFDTLDPDSKHPIQTG
jgi:kumamolisin